MHPIVATIRSLLEEKNIPYRYFEHEEGSTSEEMARIRKNYSLTEGAKALILKTDAGFVQAVVPGDRKFSNKKLRALARTRNIRFATGDELATITDGIVPGAIPPFGNLFNLPVYIDESLLANEHIVFNCGERSASIAMRPDDYRNAVRPTVADISSGG